MPQIMVAKMVPAMKPAKLEARLCPILNLKFLFSSEISSFMTLFMVRLYHNSI